MSLVVLDDHLLRDLLADRQGAGLQRLLRRHEPATTNLFVYRLCRSVVAARGGALTGSWNPQQRLALGRRLLTLGTEVAVLPLAELTFRMAELAASHQLSTLGAEAVAAAERLPGALAVWEGDDGPRIRSAASAVGVAYRTVSR